MKPFFRKILPRLGMAESAGSINKLWGSNIAGGIASAGIGVGAHELEKKMMPGAENMSSLGNSASTGINSVMAALLLTPFGRQLMMKGKGGKLLANSKRPLFGAGRMTLDMWNPNKVVGTVVPKALASLLIPTLDSVGRGASSMPNIGQHLEAASKSLSETSKGMKDTLDEGNTKLFGSKDTDPATGEVKDNPGLFDDLSKSVQGIGEGASGITGLSKALEGATLETKKKMLGENEKYNLFTKKTTEAQPGVLDKLVGGLDRATNTADTLTKGILGEPEGVDPATGAVKPATPSLGTKLSEKTDALSGDLKTYGGAVAGAGGGYLVGGLLGEMVSSKKNPDRSRRLKAALQVLGMLGGGAAGYHFGKKASMNPLTIALYKAALSQTDIERLIPENTGFTGGAADALMFPSAQRRAGRARGLAESLGNKVPLGVNYPATHRGLLTLGGAAGGAVLGGGVGALIGELDSTEGNNVGASGAAVGGGIGALAGIIMSIVNRRRQVLDVKHEAMKDIKGGREPSPAIGRGSPFAALASGVHQQGRADTAQAVAMGRKHFRGNPVMTGMTAASYAPYIGSMMGLPLLAGSVYNYADAGGRLDNAEPRAVRQMR